MRVRNIVLIFFGLLLLAVIGGGYYLYTHRDWVLKVGIEHIGSDVLQTSVHVDRVVTDWNLAQETASVALFGVSVDNPPNFSAEPAFQLGEVNVVVDLGASSEQLRTIPRIRIVAPELYYEVGSDGSNLDWFRERLAERSAASPAEDPGAGAAPSEESNRLAIGTFSFRDAQLRARVQQLGDRELELMLPGFELHELGGSEGAPPAEIATEVITELASRALRTLSRDVGREQLRRLEQAVEAPLGEAAEKATDLLRSFGVPSPSDEP